MRGTFLLIASIGVLAFLRLNQKVPGPLFQLLRVLFPSWRFFEELTEVPILWVRVEGGEWVRVIQFAKRTPGTLLFNSQGNLLFAYHSLVQRMIQDLADLKDSQDIGRELEKLVSYRLVIRLVEFHLRGRGPVSYQFKITSLLNGKFEDTLISSVYSI